MVNIIDSILNLNIHTGKKFLEVYHGIKEYLIQEFTAILEQRKTDPRGRKRSVDLDKFFESMFAVCDNSLKTSNIQPYFGIPKSTYYKYFKVIVETNFFENVNKMIVNSFVPKEDVLYTITDTYTFKSMDGHDGLGRNPTDRGRRGGKCSTIVDNIGVIHSAVLSPANTHDAKLLAPTIEASVTDLTGKIMYADSGYAGAKYIGKINRACRINLISKPKKTRKIGVMSHSLSPEQTLHLQKRRNLIERINQNMRNFRGLMIKYFKQMTTYKTYLFLAILCINIYMIHSKT